MNSSKSLLSAVVFLLCFSAVALAGYELHIERDGGIKLNEWLKLCAKDPELKHEQEIKFTNPETQQEFVMSLDGMCVFKREDQTSTFYHSSGSVKIKYSEMALSKAKSIAKTLNAQVVGDEGETYE